MNPRVISVKYKTGYKLIAGFANGEEKIFDLEPYLSFPVYEKLREESFCNKAKVQNGTVVWDEETDMDPDRLYLESKPIQIEQL